MKQQGAVQLLLSGEKIRDTKAPEIGEVVLRYLLGQHLHRVGLGPALSLDIGTAPCQLPLGVHRKDIVFHLVGSQPVLLGITGRAVGNMGFPAVGKASRHGDSAVKGGVTAIEAPQVSVLGAGGDSGGMAHKGPVDLPVHRYKHMTDDKRFFHTFLLTSLKTHPSENGRTPPASRPGCRSRGAFRPTAADVP